MGFKSCLDNYDRNLKIKKNFEFLDTIDFLPYIKENHEICSLMSAVVKHYNESTGNIPEFLDNDIFNFVDSYSFAMYLKNRYSFKRIQEVLTYYIEE